MEFVIVGLGSAGKRHAANLFALKQKIIAVADPRLERKQLDEQRGTEGFSDPDECLEQYANGRAVIIASPHQFHYRQFRKAVDNGAFAILVEKPIAVFPKDAAKMVFDSESLGVRAAVNFNWRYHEAFRNAVTNLGHNSLNMLSILSGDDITTWPAYSDDCYMLHPEYGGVGLTTGVHSIDMAVKLNGPAQAVLGSFEGAATQLPQTGWFRIYHDNGSQSMIMAEWSTSEFFAISALNPNGGTALNMRSEKYSESVRLMHYHLMQDFLKFAETGERPPLLPDPREAYEGLVILHACAQSYNTQSLVNIQREET